MENRHVTQALQEMLSDLPPEEQALEILFFTKRMETLEATELSRIDSNAGSDWPGIDGNEVDSFTAPHEERHPKIKKTSRVAPSKVSGVSLPVFLGVAALALIVVVSIVTFLMYRIIKPDNAVGADNTSAGSDSQYVEPVEGG